MPDFAMPASISSPAHAHLITAVQDLVSNPPAGPLAILRVARRGAAQVVTVDATATPRRTESDPWWGRVSEHVIAVGNMGAHSTRRADW